MRVVQPPGAALTAAGAREALRDLATAAHDAAARSWAVVGAVPGADPETHDALGRLAVRLGISRLVVVGEGAAAVHAGAVLEGSWGDESLHVADAAAAAAAVAGGAGPDDLVLLLGPDAAAVGAALTREADA